MALEDFSVEELRRLIARHRFVIDLFHDRLSLITRENAELLAIIDELQRDLAEARQVLADLRDSEATLHPGVASEHAVVHPVSGEQPVPGGNSTVPSR